MTHATTRVIRAQLLPSITFADTQVLYKLHHVEASSVGKESEGVQHLNARSLYFFCCASSSSIDFGTLTITGTVTLLRFRKA